MQTTLRELNSNSSALARRAQSGETVVITDRGVPIADIVPHRPEPSGVSKRNAADMFRRLTWISTNADTSDSIRAQLDELIDPFVHPEHDE